MFGAPVASQRRRKERAKQAGLAVSKAEELNFCDNAVTWRAGRTERPTSLDALFRPSRKNRFERQLAVFPTCWLLSASAPANMRVALHSATQLRVWARNGVGPSDTLKASGPFPLKLVCYDQNTCSFVSRLFPRSHCPRLTGSVSLRLEAPLTEARRARGRSDAVLHSLLR